MKPFPTTNRGKYTPFRRAGFSWFRLIALDRGWVEWELRYGPHTYRWACLAGDEVAAYYDMRRYAASNLRLARRWLRQRDPQATPR